jgi:hypothetical protein
MKNHAMAKSGRGTNKKRRWCNLAWLEADDCWSRSWRCKEGRAWWSEVVVLPGVENKMGKGRLAEEKEKKTREEMIFCQLCTLISLLSDHEIHPYL